MTRIIAALLLTSLSFLSLLAFARPRRTRASMLDFGLLRGPAWPKEVRRLVLSRFRWTILTRRRDSAAAADVRPGTLAAPVRLARIRKARFRDGVVGFVCGLVLVAMVLAAAVAFAAQPPR